VYYMSLTHVLIKRSTQSVLLSSTTKITKHIRCFSDNALKWKKKPFPLKKTKGPKKSKQLPKSNRFDKENRPQQVDQSSRLRYSYNDNISLTQVRVIDEQGKMIGIMDTSKGIELAKSKGLDLVQINPKTDVCKLINWKEFKKEKAIIKAKEESNQISQAKIKLKTLRIRPKIDPHDLEIKTDHAKKFFEKGHRVKFVLMLKRPRVQQDAAGKEIEETSEQKMDRQKALGILSKLQEQLKDEMTFVMSKPDDRSQAPFMLCEPKRKDSNKQKTPVTAVPSARTLNSRDQTKT